MMGREGRVHKITSLVSLLNKQHQGFVLRRPAEDFESSYFDAGPPSGSIRILPVKLLSYLLKERIKNDSKS